MIFVVYLINVQNEHDPPFDVGYPNFLLTCSLDLSVAMKWVMDHNDLWGCFWMTLVT